MCIALFMRPQEGCWEPYSKYIEENYFSFFSSLQESIRYLLTNVALNAWYEPMIVGRYLLVSCMLRNCLKKLFSMYLEEGSWKQHFLTSIKKCLHDISSEIIFFVLMQYNTCVPLFTWVSWPPTILAVFLSPHLQSPSWQQVLPSEWVRTVLFWDFIKNLPGQ